MQKIFFQILCGRFQFIPPLGINAGNHCIVSKDIQSMVFSKSPFFENLTTSKPPFLKSLGLADGSGDHIDRKCGRSQKASCPFHTEIQDKGLG